MREGEREGEEDGRRGRQLECLKMRPTTKKKQEGKGSGCKTSRNGSRQEVEREEGNNVWFLCDIFFSSWFSLQPDAYFYCHWSSCDIEGSSLHVLFASFLSFLPVLLPSSSPGFLFLPCLRLARMKPTERERERKTWRHHDWMEGERIDKEEKNEWLLPSLYSFFPSSSSISSLPLFVLFLLSSSSSLSLTQWSWWWWSCEVVHHETLKRERHKGSVWRERKLRQEETRRRRKRIDMRTCLPDLLFSLQWYHFIMSRVLNEFLVPIDLIILCFKIWVADRHPASYFAYSSITLNSSFFFSSSCCRLSSLTSSMWIFSFPL